MMPSFEGAGIAVAPFPHASSPAILTADAASVALSWLRSDAPWKLRVESFYEQYEFSLLSADLPSHLRGLTNAKFVDALRSFLRESVGAPEQLDLVDVSAHKLVS